jgi:hypothetical protein
MKLFKYLEFIVETKEKITGLFKLSRDIKYKLNILIDNFNDPIANAFLELDRSYQDMTYINVSHEDNKILYIPMDKVKSFFDDPSVKRYSPSMSLNDLIRIIEVKPEPGKLYNFYYDKKISFTEIYVGRFIKKLFIDTFTDSQVSVFVERWISTNTNGEFKIWETDKIMDAYSSGNYEEYMGSSLDHSCMNDDSSVNFYRVCPSVKILVLLNNDGDIKGRALLWETTTGKKIMDRIYYNTEADYQRFIKWSIENGYYTRSKAYGSSTSFNFGGKPEVITLKEKVIFPNIEEYKNEYFPYIDTFCYAKDGFGTNYEPTDPGKYFKLQETDGTYEDLYNIDPKQRDMSENENW